MNFLQYLTDSSEDHICGDGAELSSHEDEMSPTIQRINHYWTDHQERAGSIPNISDVELMDVYDIAPNIVIDDIADDIKLCSNRFWGSELTNRFSFEGTGKPVALYQPQELSDLVLNRYQRIVRSQSPVWEKTTKLNGQYNFCTTMETIHLPLLGREKNKIQHVISVFDFSRQEHSR